MVLVLVERSNALTIYNEDFERGLSRSLFDFYWLVPNP
jgi:hypothetical protein